MLEVFANPLFTNSYIEWLYRASPEGEEVATNERENERLLGHYAIVPHTYIVDGQSLRFGLSLNTAVAETARGKGLFTSLAQKTYEQAEREGIDAIIGVANANSTPGFVKKLGFRLLGGLPVTVGATIPWAGSAKSVAVTHDYLTNELHRAKYDVEWTGSGVGCRPVWSLELLRWRLAQPNARYWLHHHDNWLAVSTVERRAGLKVAIVLKAWPRLGSTLSRSTIRAICAAHNTPFYLHAGTSRPLGWFGVPLPSRLRPAPLNLIYRPLTKRAPKAESVAIADFDFLDFDAY